MPSVPDWRLWTRDRWNRALFAYCFEAHGDPSPRRRIPALPEDLRRVTGDEAAACEEVEAEFLRAVWAPRKSLENRLSLASAVASQPSDGSAPPHFVYLYLTCYAGAGGNGVSVVKLSQFRDRMNELMGGVTKGYETQMGLSGLGKVWRSFASWLNAEAPKRGWRGLVLPDGDWRTRIGPSLNLAFPSRKDRLALARVLEPLRGYSPPPVDGVRRLVAPRVSARVSPFTKDFAQRWDDFDRAFARGDGRLLYAHPFWEAVLDAIRLDTAGRTPRAPLRVVMNPDRRGGEDRLLVLTHGDAPMPSGWETTPVSPTPSGFNAVVVPTGGTYGGAAERLFTRGGWPREWAHPFAKLVNEGVLPFCRDADDLYALQTTRPPRGVEAWLLANAKRTPELSRLANSEPRLSPYSGWSWVHFRDALPLHGLLRGALADVGVLQETVAPKALRLVGGARTSEGGHLGRAGTLPSVLAPVDVTRVTARPRRGGAEVPTSRRAVEGPFSFGPATELSGEFLLEGFDRGGRVVATANARFDDGEAATRFLVPGSLDGYFVEGGEDAAEAEARAAAWTPSKPEAPSWLTNPPGLFERRGGRTAPGAPPPTPTDPSVSGDVFVEVVAARASRRSVLPEMDLVSVAERHLGVAFSRGRGGPVLGWDVLRSWEEAGAWDVLHNERAAPRVYLVRPVTLLLTAPDEEEGPAVAAVDGLLTSLAAKRLRGAAEALGARLERQTGTTPWTAPTWRVVAPSADRVRDVGERSDLPVRDSPPLVGVPVGRSAGFELGEPLAGRPARLWDWDTGRFVPPDGAEGAGPVRLAEHQPVNGPAFYGVTTRGRTRFFRTRNRAVLEALAASGRPGFNLTPVGVECRTGAGARLPVPLARALVARTGLAPEVAPGPGWRPLYVYPCPDPALAEAVLEALEGGRAGVPEAVRTAPGWVQLAAAYESAGGQGQFLPFPYGASMTSYGGSRAGVPAHAWPVFVGRRPRVIRVEP